MSLFNLKNCQSSYDLINFSSLQKYASAFEKERVGMVELPYLSEERLQKMGVPLGPRLRILQEARISVCKDPVYVVWNNRQSRKNRKEQYESVEKVNSEYEPFFTEIIFLRKRWKREVF